MDTVVTVQLFSNVGSDACQKKKTLKFNFETQRKGSVAFSLVVHSLNLDLNLAFGSTISLNFDPNPRSGSGRFRFEPWFRTEHRHHYLRATNCGFRTLLYHHLITISTGNGTWFLPGRSDNGTRRSYEKILRSKRNPPTLVIQLVNKLFHSGFPCEPGSTTLQSNVLCFYLL